MDNRTLLHTKAKQIKVSNSSPINSDGQNGDMQLIVSSNIDNNELLYIKINNEWKIIGLENKPNFTSGRTIPNVDKIQHKGDEAISINSSTLELYKGTVYVPGATNVLAANGSIPITPSFVKIDANGGARTGIRFEETGSAGQIIIVQNSGGEALTFHNTEGTALVRGIAAAHDTMEANFVGLFVSDGSLWNLIAGGVDSQPDVGLTAS